MEIAGGTKIFSSPEGKHGLYYTSFYGDGDSKAYPAVKGIYGQSKPIKKFKCVGNCQKSLISRLRNLKNKNTVGLGRKEKLTKIDTVQNYFGIALRSKVGNLVAMKSARMAWMYHIKILPQNLKIHGVSIKMINRTTPTTTNQRMINPLM